MSPHRVSLEREGHKAFHPCCKLLLHFIGKNEKTQHSHTDEIKSVTLLHLLAMSGHRESEEEHSKGGNNLERDYAPLVCPSLENTISTKRW